MRLWLPTVLAASLASGALAEAPVAISTDTVGPGALADLQASIGLTDAEAAQIRRSVGRVRCVGSEFTAALVGTNMLLATVAHGFYDEEGREFGPLDACYFTTWDDSNQTYALDFTSGTHHIGSHRAQYDGPLDYAVVRLMEPVPGAIPFVPAVRPLDYGERVILAATPRTIPLRGREDWTPSTPDVVVQLCANRGRITRSIRRDEHNIAAYFLGCVAGPGMSGSPILGRNSEGNLSVYASLTRNVGEVEAAYRVLGAENGSQTISLEGLYWDALVAVAATIPADTPKLIVAPRFRVAPLPDETIAP